VHCGDVRKTPAHIEKGKELDFFYNPNSAKQIGNIANRMVRGRVV
jgi:hypothetical protein